MKVRVAYKKIIHTKGSATLFRFDGGTSEWIPNSWFEFATKGKILLMDEWAAKKKELDYTSLYNIPKSMDFIDLNHPCLRVNLVPNDNIEANDYNPNNVAPPEMRLLHLSIKKDCVTMPIVSAINPKTHKHIIIDGFHRATIIKNKKEICKSLGGYTPVVQLNKPLEERISSTVRHNMARGTHQVALSSKLIILLRKHNWSDKRIGLELGMDPDEVLRLKQMTGLAEAFSDKEFSKSWEMVEDE